MVALKIEYLVYFQLADYYFCLFVAVKKCEPFFCNIYGLLALPNPIAGPTNLIFLNFLNEVNYFL